MSLQSLARVLLRASRRFGVVDELSIGERAALLEAELIKATTPSRYPRYKLTKQGWDLARRLERASALSVGGMHGDGMADH